MNKNETIFKPLSDKEIKNLSDEEFDKYCSKIIKQLVDSFGEVGEFENY